MEALVWPVQHVLSPNAPQHCFVDIVRKFGLAGGDREDSPCVLRGLEKAGDDGGLVGKEKLRLLAQLGKLVLTVVKSVAEHSLPLRVLELQCVE